MHTNGITLTHCTITLTMNIQQFCQNFPAQSSMTPIYEDTGHNPEPQLGVRSALLSFIIR